MPKHRSLNLKKFVDSIPGELLDKYLIWKCGNISTPESYDFEAVEDFLNSLTDQDLKSSILEDFQHINDICEKTINILVKAARLYGIEITDEEKKQELAMNIYLNHRNAFDYAYDYYCLFNATSKMSYHNMPPCDLVITPEKIGKFKARIIEFYSNLAKGHKCIIRPYNEDDQTVIVVIRGSYQRSVSIWQKEDLETIFFRPAHEDILQFDKKTSVLSIKAPYQKDKDNYIKAFREAILEDDSQEEYPNQDATYTLEPLQKGAFNFIGNEVIRSITLLKVRLSIRGFTSPDVVIRSSDILETFKSDLGSIDLNSGDLVHAKFRFELEIDGKLWKVNFEITPPNVTDLTTKKYADIISTYLKENGVKLV